MKNYWYEKRFQKLLYLLETRSMAFWFNFIESWGNKTQKCLSLKDPPLHCALIKDFKLAVSNFVMLMSNTGENREPWALQEDEFPYTIIRSIWIRSLRTIWHFKTDAKCWRISYAKMAHGRRKFRNDSADQSAGWKSRGKNKFLSGEIFTYK